jgi:stage III sporulation protein SpoIIIAA
MAASTIAQRGVQLVGTAHGVTIDSIIKNPCLQMLVGGIEVHFFLFRQSVHQEFYICS